MSSWSNVREELDEWQRRRLIARFWWRDDDAVTDTPQLRKMAALAQEHDVTIGLSVIPARAEKKLVLAVERLGCMDVLVHGLSHINHSAPGRAKIELGGVRRPEQILEDIAKGLQQNQKLFGRKALGVLVPPWNRISRRVVSRLPEIGVRGLSTWKPTDPTLVVPGLVQVNTHLDLINWRAGQTVKPDGLVSSLLLRKLKWRRQNPDKTKEPIGVLTHHLHWSQAMEDRIRMLLNTTLGHKGACWLTPRIAFGL